MTQTIKVPAVAYLTNASKAYYERAEEVEAIGFTLQLAWNEKQLTFPDAENKEVVYTRIPQSETDSAFPKARLLFYKLETRTGSVGRPVRRVAVLGIKGRDEFGFFKTVDYLNYAEAQDTSGEIDFQIFASGGGNYRHEAVIEAGSVASLV